MEKLTFKNQLILGVAILLAGFACASATKIPACANVGCIMYGFLFVIHPVWPERARNPRMALYMRLTGVVIILLGLIGRFGV